MNLKFVARISRHALLAGTAIVTLPLLPSDRAQAQSVWGGTGSSTTTTTYGDSANWSNPPGTAPTTAGSSADFNGSGNTTVNVGSGPITPDVWTFYAGNYTVTGQAVNFNGGGPNLINHGGNNSVANNLTGGDVSVTDGSLTLSGNNSFTTATVLGGTLVFGSANAVGSGSAVTVSAGATLDLAGYNGTIGTLAGSGSVALGSGKLTLGNHTNTAFNGTIFGSGGLEKVGTGLLTLSGTNTYSGTTTFTSGDVAISAGSNLGTGGLVFNGGRLSLNGNASLSQAVTLTGLAQITTASSTTSTLSGVISGGAAINLSGSGTLIFSGANTYIGSTNINGGTLQAGGMNVLGNGSAVSISAGSTLALDNYNQTIGSLAGGGVVSLGSATLTAGGNNGTTSLSGYLFGTGGLTKTGTGTLTLSGPNTYSGATTISAGQLEAGATNAFSNTSTVQVAAGATLDLANLDQTIGSLAGAGSVTLGSARLTAGGDNSSTSFAGTMSGTGGLTKLGSGSLALSGTSTYSGETVVNGGRLSLQNNQAIGTGSLRVQSGLIDYAAGVYIANGMVLDSNVAQLQVLSGSARQFGAISENSGPRPLEKIGAGTLILENNNTYTGFTTITAGAISAQNASALGAGTAGTWVASGAALQLYGGITIGETLTLNGSGTAGDGALRNTLGFNEASGAITLNSATRIAADVGQLTLSGGISGAGHNLSIGGAGNMIVSSTIATGTGSLSKDGAGTVTLSSVNTYTGATNVAAGTLRAGVANAINAASAMTMSGGTFDLNGFAQSIASLAGSGAITTGGATLTTGGGNGSTSFAGVMSGTGGLTKTGTGNFELTGNSTYTGVTTVNAGTLSVNGTIASSSLTTVNAGGSLGGNGTVGNTAINGGTLSPGNSIGTLTVQGNLVLTSASSYMVEVAPSTADRVNVTGTAALGGATVNASFATGSYISKQYTILNAAGGVTGTFGSQVNTNLPSNFTSSLSYDGNNAYLNLSLNYVPPTPPTPVAPTFPVMNGNQWAIAQALINYFNRNGGIPFVFGSLNAAGFTQISGETATSQQQSALNAMTQFMGIFTDPFTSGRSEAVSAIGFADTRAPIDAFASMHRKAPVAAHVFQERWNVWAAGFGGSQTTDGSSSAGSNRSSSSIYGTAVGADYWLSPQTVAGFALAGGGTNFAVANGGSGRSDLFQAGAFVRHSAGSAYLTAALAYGWQDITTDRNVTVAGFDRLRARFNANTYSGRVEGGNRYLMNGIGLTPFAAAQISLFDLPAYAESAIAGANTFALSYAGQSVMATRSELGLRADKSFAVNGAILTLRGRAAWAHDFNTERAATATFQSLPGASFVVNGASLARDAALTTVSAEMKWMNGWSAAATFEGEFSDVTSSYAGKGLVRYAW